MARTLCFPTAIGVCGLALLMGLAGCATPAPPPKARTTVVLLPDEDGNVGAVTVTSLGGTQRVDQAFASASVGEAASAPSRAASLGRESVEASFGDLLKAQPHKPITFVLHFQLDKTVLTDESRALIPAVLAAARQRKPTEITVFGHADASGTEKRNLRISADRARMVAELLKKDDPMVGEVDVQFFGDKEPLVASEPGVAEPKNRRAEILIL